MSDDPLQDFSNTKGNPIADLANILNKKAGFDEFTQNIIRTAQRQNLSSIAEHTYHFMRGVKTGDALNTEKNKFVEALNTAANGKSNLANIKTPHMSSGWVHYKSADISEKGDPTIPNTKLYITLPPKNRMDNLPHLYDLMSEIGQLESLTRLQIKIINNQTQLEEEHDNIVIHFQPPEAASDLEQAVIRSGIPRYDRAKLGKTDFGMNDKEQTDTEIIGSRFEAELKTTIPKLFKEQDEDFSEAEKNGFKAGIAYTLAKILDDRKQEIEGVLGRSANVSTDPNLDIDSTADLRNS